MGKQINMTLVVVNIKKPISILFHKVDPSDNDVMETVGRMIIDQMQTSAKLNIDQHFEILHIPIEEEKME